MVAATEILLRYWDTRTSTPPPPPLSDTVLSADRAIVGGLVGGNNIIKTFKIFGRYPGDTWITLQCYDETHTTRGSQGRRHLTTVQTNLVMMRHGEVV